MVLQVGISPQSYDYCDTEYFKLIHSNDMQMQMIFQIIFVMNLIEWTKPLANVSLASCLECLEIWQEGSWCVIIHAPTPKTITAYDSTFRSKRTPATSLCQIKLPTIVRLQNRMIWCDLSLLMHICLAKGQRNKCQLRSSVLKMHIFHCG